MADFDAFDIAAQLDAPILRKQTKPIRDCGSHDKV